MISDWKLWILLVPALTWLALTVANIRIDGSNDDLRREIVERQQFMGETTRLRAGGHCLRS